MIWNQEFYHIGPYPIDEMTDEEVFAVWNWLRKHGFTDDKTMPKLITEEQ